jgi:hypothetical protein
MVMLLSPVISPELYKNVWSVASPTVILHESSGNGLFPSDSEFLECGISVLMLLDIRH